MPSFQVQQQDSVVGVHEVVLFTYSIGSEFGDTTYHVVGFRLHGADSRSPNPFGWGPTRKDLEHGAHRKIRAVVRHHAPQVRVRNVGEVRYQRPTPRRRNG